MDTCFRQPVAAVVEVLGGIPRCCSSPGSMTGAPEPQPNRGPAATWKGGIPRSIPRLAAVTGTGARLSVQSRGVDVRVVGRLQRVDSRGELPELVGVPQTDTERPRGPRQRSTGQRGSAWIRSSRSLIVPSPHGPASAIVYFRIRTSLAAALAGAPRLAPALRPARGGTSTTGRSPIW